jgi:predicted porin
MVSGDTVGSNWGLKGTEDLGGGLSDLPARERVSTRAPARSASRHGCSAGRPTSGLDSDRFGTLTLGRQYDPTLDMWSPFAAAGNWLGDFGAHPHDNDNADWDYRIQNSVKYVSPAYGGFKGEVLYGSRIRRAASPATASTAPRCSTRPVRSPPPSRI